MYTRKRTWGNTGSVPFQSTRPTILGTAGMDATSAGEPRPQIFPSLRSRSTPGSGPGHFGMAYTLPVEVHGRAGGGQLRAQAGGGLPRMQARVVGRPVRADDVARVRGLIEQPRHRLAQKQTGKAPFRAACPCQRVLLPLSPFGSCPSAGNVK